MKEEKENDTIIIMIVGVVILLLINWGCVVTGKIPNDIYWRNFTIFVSLLVGSILYKMISSLGDKK